MNAAVFYEKNDLRIEDIAMPQLGDDDVLIRVHACGVCGTDAHIFCGDEGAAATPAGTALGHEFAGEVVEIGKDVRGIAIGDHVCVDPNKLCGKCTFCLGGAGHFCTDMIGIGTTVNGGFAEYCAVPSSQVHRVSKELPYEAAAMTEPVSCCLHGIDLCNIRCGSTVAVIGCGMIGMLMLQLAKMSGAGRLIAIEPIAKKRAKALELGADLAFDPMSEDIADCLHKEGIGNIDTVIECVGSTSTIEQAIELAGNNSTVMMFGLTAPTDEIRVRPFTIFKKEIELKSSFINPYTFPRALALIENGKIDVTSMIHEKITIDELPTLLTDAKQRSAGKYIVTL